MTTPESFARLRRKLHQIAASELTLSSKIAYVADVALGLFRSPVSAEYRKYRLTGDASVVWRENSTDRKLFDEIFLENAYAPFATPLGATDAPTILIDLGANIGLSAVALARHVKPEIIIAVEPDARSFALLQENLRHAGLSERSKTIRAFAGAERGFAQLVDSANGTREMRLGAPARAGIPVWRIEDLAALAGLLIGEAADIFDGKSNGGAANASKEPAARIVLKCSIEGAEALLFQTLDRWEHLVQRVILQLHTEFLPVESLHACLDASHYSWRIEGEIPSDAVLAVIALVRGERKPVPQTHHATVS